MSEAHEGNRAGQRKIRVAVLFGGQSEEHDVSLRSAQTVMRSLDPDRYEAVPVGITRDGQWIAHGDPMLSLTANSPFFALGDGATSWEAAELTVLEEPPASALAEVIADDVDVVFPVLHGPMGEDGTIQGMLELVDKAYVGSGVLGSAVAMDKAMTKVILEGAGIPGVEWMLVQRHDWQRDPEGVADTIAERIGFPCFSKPANLGSSVGIVKVHDASELGPALDEAARLDRRIVVERGHSIRELEIAVLGNDDPIASCVGEIVPANEFYDYAAKYIDDRSALIVPADIPPETTAEIQRLAIAAFRALDLAGLARVDFFLDKESGAIYLNEVNTMPGFTSISMYPRLWEASGISNAELVTRLIELALDRRGHGDPAI